MFNLFGDIVGDNFRVPFALGEIIFVPSAFPARPKIRFKIIAAIWNQQIDPQRQNAQRLRVDMNVLMRFKKPIGHLRTVR